MTDFITPREVHATREANRNRARSAFVGRVEDALQALGHARGRSGTFVDVAIDHREFVDEVIADLRRAGWRAIQQGSRLNISLPDAPR